MSEVTARDKYDAAKREVGFRKRVYARHVADGKMTQKLADYQVAVMESIMRDYEPAALAIIEEERTRQGSLL